MKDENTIKVNSFGKKYQSYNQTRIKSQEKGIILYYKWWY